MRYQGINLENIKFNNRSSILRLLNNNGAMSRKDIAGAVGLTAASVTLICTELLEEGVIVELGEAAEEKRAGRKKILLDLNHDFKKAVCIDIESEETYIAVTDLKGKVYAGDTVPTDRAARPETFLKRVTDACKEMLKKQGTGVDKILGIAVTVPGKVDHINGRSLNSFNIWTEEVPVKDIIEKQLGSRVLVENNLKAYAQGEIEFGRGRSEDDLFILKWGPGVGSAIIVDHRIYKGANGMAAEIGHMTSGKDGRLCNCGRYGCLETEVSTHAIIADIEECASRSPESMPILGKWLSEGNSMTYRNVSEWIGLHDPGADKIIDAKLDLMAHSVRNAVSLTDPGKVVVIGYMFDVPGLFDRFRSIYKEYDPQAGDDFFVKSELSDNSQHTEGLAVLLEELFFAIPQK